MKISDFIQKDLVTVNLKSHTSESAIYEIVDQLYRKRKIKDKKQILESLLKREKIGSTGIGDGVAIPHARIEDLKGIYIMDFLFIIIILGLVCLSVGFINLCDKI